MSAFGGAVESGYKMALFTNLERVEAGGGTYNPVPILKLTSGRPFDPDALRGSRRRFWETLTSREAKENGFLIRQEHSGQRARRPKSAINRER